MAVNDIAFSLRFKYGAHTVLLFVDSDKPFSEISTELLEILHDRFADGLAISHTLPDRTPLPALDSNVRIAYALPLNSNDLTQGWKDLKINGDETPIEKNLKENYPVAFAFVPEGEEDEKVEFVVDVPSLDEAYGEEEE